MAWLREYLVSIVSASLLSGILIRLTRNSASGEIVRMLCGILITIVLIQTYILSRAGAMDADIQASVTLGENFVPCHVRITGRISPINRSKLTQIIASELGIPREQQEWIGQ